MMNYLNLVLVKCQLSKIAHEERDYTTYLQLATEAHEMMKG